MLYSPPDATSRQAYHGGTCPDAYRWMGAHKTGLDGREWQFTVWAPHAQRVCVTGEFCGWRYEDYPMEKQYDGTWEARLPATLFEGGEHLRAYKYAILCADGQWHLRADPSARKCAPATPAAWRTLAATPGGMKNGWLGGRGRICTTAP